MFTIPPPQKALGSFLRTMCGASRCSCSQFRHHHAHHHTTECCSVIRAFYTTNSRYVATARYCMRCKPARPAGRGWSVLEQCRQVPPSSPDTSCAATNPGVPSIGFHQALSAGRQRCCILCHCASLLASPTGRMCKHARPDVSQNNTTLLPVSMSEACRSCHSARAAPRQPPAGALQGVPGYVVPPVAVLRTQPSAGCQFCTNVCLIFPFVPHACSLLHVDPSPLSPLCDGPQEMRQLAHL